jgi:hypothetical protein
MSNLVRELLTATVGDRRAAPAGPNGGLVEPIGTEWFNQYVAETDPLAGGRVVRSGGEVSLF